MRKLHALDDPPPTEDEVAVAVSEARAARSGDADPHKPAPTE